MDAEDAWSAELKRLLATPNPDPPALDEVTAERLLDGALGPDQAPPGYAAVAELLAATVAAPSPAELAAQEAALAELRTVTRPLRVAVPRGAGKPGRRRRVGLVVAIAVGALSTGGIAVAATGQVPDPIRDAARRIFTTGTDATPNPGRQPAPHAGNADAGGAITDGQGARPAGEPGAMTDAVNDDRCRASRAPKGAGKKMDGATSNALADGAGGADTITASCQRSQPGGTGTSGQEKPAQSGNHRHEQPGKSPPSTDSKPGRGQDGPPPNSGGGNPEPGKPTRDKAAQAIAPTSPAEQPQTTGRPSRHQLRPAARSKASRTERILGVAGHAMLMPLQQPKEPELPEQPSPSENGGQDQGGPPADGERSP
jgi:hypothetical protein